MFQSPMGIVSSAKTDFLQRTKPLAHVSIPDGDSFLREAANAGEVGAIVRVSIPDGDSFLREVSYRVYLMSSIAVSIPDGDSFLREGK